MPHILRAQVRSANDRLAVSIAQIQAALSGQGQFQERDVRELSAPVAEMAPLLERANILRNFDPELGSLLDTYIARLAEIQLGLDKLRVMLLTTHSSLESSQTQLHAVSQWAEAYRQTR